MAKLARLPAMERAPQADRGAHQQARLRTRYYAFLSYSHKDKALADWLHRELERFRVPAALAGQLAANGVVPARLTPVFRDQQDLSAGADLAEEIEAALAASQFLIVLCSPEAARSRWTNAEVESFKRTRPEGCVLAAVAAGEPFASDLPGREGEECFPPALRYKYDRRGHQTAKRAEPLAADFRADGEGRRLAFLKLVAGMLGVGLDELVQRDQTRRQRRMAWLVAASLAGMTVTSGLALTAIQARDAARDQRREAEGLISFMLGDLKGKLEPIGRLDALDGVGSRVLAYYSKQDTAQLSDAALLQRSKALSLMAQVADARGDTEGSLKLYREAMAGTAETIRRKPNDAEALFDHAQNVFYIGQIAHRRGDLQTAENSVREYQRLADRMVALQPDSMRFRMEGQYAHTNLGVVLMDQRRFGDAVPQFKQALTTMDGISTADPANSEYRSGVAESLAWLGDAERAAGNYEGAIAARKRQILLLEQLLQQTRDVQYRQRLIPARRSLGNMYVERGQAGEAVEQFRAAVNEAGLLTAVEPGNAQWKETAFNAQLDLARQLMASDRNDAAAQVAAGCTTVQSLLRSGSKPSWKKGLATCMILQSRLAAAAGSADSAAGFAQQAVNAARAVHTSNAADDAYSLAGAYRALGDAERGRGNGAAAKAAWELALAAIPAGASKPNEMMRHASILQRLGRPQEAAALNNRLRAIGYLGSD